METSNSEKYATMVMFTFVLTHIGLIDPHYQWLIIQPLRNICREEKDNENI